MEIPKAKRDRKRSSIDIKSYNDPRLIRFVYPCTTASSDSTWTRIMVRHKTLYFLLQLEPRVQKNKDSDTH